MPINHLKKTFKKINFK